jgi:DNA-binding MarR family transcriptional regulator
MRKSTEHAKSAAADAAADDVFEAIHTVMHLYRSAQYRDGPHDLTHMEVKVLGFFGRHPGATQKDLATHSKRDKGQLARLIGSLKERGLLDGHADEADRRNIRLQLTADGRAAQQVVERQGRRLSELAVANLSGEERRQLLALLAKVRGNLE